MSKVSCKVKGCKKTVTNHSKTKECNEHYDVRRAKQTKATNTVWRGNKKKGKSDNRLMYGGHMTTYALEHPEKMQKAVSKIKDKKARKEAEAFVEKQIEQYLAKQKKSKKAAKIFKKKAAKKKVKTAAKVTLIDKAKKVKAEVEETMTDVAANA